MEEQKQLGIFNFNNNNITIIGDSENPWFIVKEIAEILGITSYRNFISKLESEQIRVYQINTNKGTRNVSIMNESGLYEMIFRSDKEIAKQFRKWVFNEVLPSIRKKGKYELEEQHKKEIEEFSKKLEEKEEQYKRVYNVNIELLNFKKLKEKNESIYIVSTYDYSRQGIYKVGRTKNMKDRNSQHNNTHVNGDKVKVLAEFKVNNSVLTENVIHKKLQGLLIADHKEFFMVPFDQLRMIIDLIVNHDDTQNEIVNTIIDSVYKLKQKHYDYLDWTCGLDLEIFNESIKMITSSETEEEKELVRFDITNSTEEQKKKFIEECMEAYQRTIVQPRQQMLWKELQTYLIGQMKIPKYKFKSTEWKKIVKEYADEKQLTLQWKN